MATIKASSNEKTISIKAFLGLNESPDGDNKLKMGEATVCQNFKITDSGNLMKRFGTVQKYSLGNAPVKGMWRGWCTGHELFIAACNGHLYMLMDNEFRNSPADLGVLNTDNDVFMFGFDEKVFVMNGYDYSVVYSTDTPIASTVSASASTGLTVSVTKSTWETAITTTGKYIFISDSEYWFLNDLMVDLDDFGISVTGTPNEGDTITVTYQAAYIETAWTFASMTNPLADNYSAPYRPLVAIGIAPSGGGTLMEEVNKLSGTRRCWISPDGTNDTFQLPEKNLASVDYVKNLGTQATLTPTTDYTYNLTNGTVTFTSTPAEATNSFEIGWTVSTNFADTVAKMRFAELYAGTQDNRVFIYGDGSNRTFYSGLDYDGHPRGDYFPDLYEVTIGDKNTPITGMIRHYAKMLVFKSESTYSIDYGVTTLADGLLTPAFYATPINKILGNEAWGQVQLVQAAPRSLAAGNVYEWRNGSTYAANISMDERQAKRIGDRVAETLRKMDFSKVHCYDDNLNTEYYIIDDDGNALVHNYLADAWYYYTGVDARIVTSIQGKLYIGTKGGKILLLDEKAMGDRGKPITCVWESGSMDFGVSYMRKYTSTLWVAIKAEEHNKVTVTAKTDRSEENTEIEVDPEYENDIPKITRCKIKVKKFVYYKLCFKSNDNNSTATVVDTEIKVRYTSAAK